MDLYYAVINNYIKLQTSMTVLKIELYLNIKATN